MAFVNAAVFFTHLEIAEIVGATLKPTSNQAASSTRGSPESTATALHGRS